MALILAGGHDDPNLTILADAAPQQGIEIVDLRLPAGEGLSFCWDPADGVPLFAGRRVAGKAAFIRQDVFAGMKDPRPEVSARALAWYQTVSGWLLSDPRIRIFNRRLSPAAMNKPAVLVWALEAGLRIPSTLVTNDVASFAKTPPESLIAKPVLGGDYCYSLPEALAKTELRQGLTATPAIVQERLAPPEVRIYVTGRTAHAFEVRSDALDYRVNQDAELVALAGVPAETAQLRRLMSRLDMDFGAADFKTDPETGRLVFLELNTSPMFARFDLVSGGALSAAILQELTA